MSDGRDKLVDKLILAFCELHDSSELWTHAKRDPEAFRRTIQHVLDKHSPSSMVQRAGLIDTASDDGAYLELSGEDDTIWCVVRNGEEIRKLSSRLKATSLSFPDVAYQIVPTPGNNGWSFSIQAGGKTTTIRMFEAR